MHPLLFIDLETTGLSANLNAPVTIGAVILAGPHDGEFFQGKMRPFEGARIEAAALHANGLQYEDIIQYPPSGDTFVQFAAWLALTHPAPQKIQPIKHNAKFDTSFLREWFLRHTDAAYYGNMFNDSICTLDVIKKTWPDHNGGRWPKKGGHKLTFQYEYHFGTAYEGAHTELADCYATRAVFLHADKVSGRNLYKEFHHYIPALPVSTTI